MSNSVGEQSPIRPSAGPVFGPGPARVTTGEVLHVRRQPTEHRFSAPVQQIWIDPDHPEELFDRHRLWSHRHRAPVQFQWRDYFDQTDQPIGAKVRNALTEVLGLQPDGPIRMLTQPRTWGWLFNPLTVYLVWPSRDPHDPVENASGPIGMLLEVDNTPWHERHHYAVALTQSGNRLVGKAAKVLHVSPFLSEDFDYRVSVGGADRPPDAFATSTTGQGLSSLDLVVNVVARSGSPDEKPILHTRLRSELHRPTTSALNRPIRNFPTHRVSLGIHSQALKLFAKRVPFVSHPDKRTS